MQSRRLIFIHNANILSFAYSKKSLTLSMFQDLLTYSPLLFHCLFISKIELFHLLISALVALEDMNCVALF